MKIKELKLLDGFPDSHVGSDSTDLAGNAFHAALALDDGVVDVGDALKEGVGWVDLCVAEKSRVKHVMK